MEITQKFLEKIRATIAINLVKDVGIEAHDSSVCEQPSCALGRECLEEIDKMLLAEENKKDLHR
jgi:hypothetical protein